MILPRDAGRGDLTGILEEFDIIGEVTGKWKLRCDVNRIFNGCWL